MNNDWMVRGLCRNHPEPDLWFPAHAGPSSQKQIAKAAAICFSCPVIDECDEWAREKRVTFGVFAGQMIRKPVDSVPVEWVHGTEAGYKRHLRRREQACRECSGAARRAATDRQARLRSA